MVENHHDTINVYNWPSIYSLKLTRSINITRSGGKEDGSPERWWLPLFTERRCACGNCSQCAAENSPTPNMSSSSSEDCLTIVEVPEDRYDEAIHHLRWNFFADEPLNNAVGLCAKGESQLELERHCLLSLKQGYSRMLVDKKGAVSRNTSLSPLFFISKDIMLTLSLFISFNNGKQYFIIIFTTYLLSIYLLKALDINK